MVRGVVVVVGVGNFGRVEREDRVDGDESDLVPAEGAMKRKETRRRHS